MTLTSCGIRPTPVLTGGEGPTVSSHSLTIYLVNAEGDGLARRSRDYTGLVDGTTALNLLLAGPTEDEKKQGLRTEVPQTTAKALPVLNLVLMPDEVYQQASKWTLFQVYCTAQANKVELSPTLALPSDFCP
ncbi:hypothetical protein JNUCC0626_18520 [Lentzea sp. JNUCC 0626]|uniref:hypothetical protein n=1 Tax=Lentzea sp. JNUCC 0626 TaxID=3367513 RepID=UPI0037492084